MHDTCYLTGFKPLATQVFPRWHPAFFHLRMGLMMMYLPLIVGALLCFAVLGSRYFAEASQPKSNRRRATWTSRAKLAKILVGAAIALYTISTTLNGLGDKLVP